MKTPSSLFLLFLLTLRLSLFAETTLIKNAQELQALPDLLNAGTTLKLADGNYANIEKIFEGEGTAEKPIQVIAENPGKVYFKGGTQITIKGKFIHLSGFRFEGNGQEDGPIKSDPVIEFARLSSDCRLSHCTFKNFNRPQAPKVEWIYLEGFRHVIEFCRFEEKTSEKPVIFAAGKDGEEWASTPRNHQIRYNYFGIRTVIGSNGFETIRMGDSKTQNVNMSCLVEKNYFYRAIYGEEHGETEIISNKSQNNIYRSNTFRENKGGLCLRHGDHCIVEGNYFFGITEGDTTASAGVRVIGENHLIRNNYFQGIGGEEFRSALVVMAGESGWTPESNHNGYEPAHGAKVFHNTFVNCKQPLNLGFTNDRVKSPVAPRDVIVANNLVQSNNTQNPAILLLNSISVQWLKNVFHHPNPSLYQNNSISSENLFFPSPLLQIDSNRSYWIPLSNPETPSLLLASPTTPITDRDSRGLNRPSSKSTIGAFEIRATGSDLGPLTEKQVGPRY